MPAHGRFTGYIVEEVKMLQEMIYTVQTRNRRLLFHRKHNCEIPRKIFQLRPHAALKQAIQFRCVSWTYFVTLLGRVCLEGRESSLDQLKAVNLIELFENLNIPWQKLTKVYDPVGLSKFLSRDFNGGATIPTTSLLTPESLQELITSRHRMQSRRIIASLQTREVDIDYIPGLIKSLSGFPNPENAQIMDSLISLLGHIGNFTGADLEAVTQRLCSQASLAKFAISLIFWARGDIPFPWLSSESIKKLNKTKTEMSTKNLYPASPLSPRQSDESPVRMSKTLFKYMDKVAEIQDKYAEESGQRMMRLSRDLSESRKSIGVLGARKSIGPPETLKLIEHRSVSRKSIEDHSPSRKSIEDHSSSRKSIEDHSSSKKPTEHHSRSKKSIENHFQSRKSLQHHSPSKKPTEHHSPSKKPTEHHCPSRKSMEHHSPSRKSVEHHSPSRNSINCSKFVLKKKNQIDPKLADLGCTFHPNILQSSRNSSGGLKNLLRSSTSYFRTSASGFERTSVHFASKIGHDPILQKKEVDPALQKLGCTFYPKTLQSSRHSHGGYENLIKDSYRRNVARRKRFLDRRVNVNDTYSHPNYGRRISLDEAADEVESEIRCEARRNRTLVT